MQAMNLGDESDTVGQLSASLRGAGYGENSVPDLWLERLEWRNELRELADMLIGS
jgi:ADP-ribosylglycohydrolase